MFGLFDSLETLVKNTVEIVATPLEIAVDLTNAATQPLADAAKEIKTTFKDTTQ